MLGAAAPVPSEQRVQRQHASTQRRSIRGKIGNELKIVIQQNEGFGIDEGRVYDVSTYIGTTLVDTQKAVKAVSDLTDNDYLHWKGSEALTENAGLLLTGGTTGAVQDAAHQTFLDKIEPYSFNAVGCDTKNSTVKGLFANWTRRLRDEQGVKFSVCCITIRQRTMRA